MFGKGSIGVIVKEKKDGNISMTHEEYRKMKIYYYGIKIFKINRSNIKIRKKIKELEDKNGTNPLS